MAELIRSGRTPGDPSREFEPGAASVVPALGGRRATLAGAEMAG